LSLPVEIVIASGNPGKVEEIRTIIGRLPVTLLTKEDAGDWGEIEETGSTYLENALIKARAVCKATGKAALADDSGIEVDFLDGGPGVRSARLAGPHATEEENNVRLASLLFGLPPERRAARYRCVAVVVFPGGREIAAMGSCEGSIALEPKGTGGFGYDPWFIPAEQTKRMAELSPEEKHSISHRGKALRGLAELLEKELTR
jgi:XTP/dITP diphosphohydrolase